MRDHVETGTLHDRPDLLYGMEEITDLMGYSKIAELEAQFLPDEQLNANTALTRSITWCASAKPEPQCASYAFRIICVRRGPGYHGWTWRRAIYPAKIYSRTTPL